MEATHLDDSDIMLYSDLILKNENYQPIFDHDNGPRNVGDLAIGCDESDQPKQSERSYAPILNGEDLEDPQMDINSNLSQNPYCKPHFIP